MMPSLDAALAVQFDKATLGLTVSVMREQILGNVESMFEPNRPALHYIHGLHPMPCPSYNVILSEYECPTIPLLQFQAAVICSDADGMRVILHGKKEVTVWAAYRSLMRITMREVGRRTSAVSTSSDIRSHCRVASAVSRDSGVAGMGSACSDAARDTERAFAPEQRLSSFRGGDRDSCTDSEKQAARKAKSLRVLGLEGMQ